ncbi:MAG TPA: ThuA domain-containing protein, partial [Solirubrobacter sp.]|nr:ThuA domain-containing protein [Solirubrobacter sp.]
MKYLTRASLVAALVAAALVPVASAHGDRPAEHRAHAHRGWHGDHGPRGHFRALIFSRTAAFRHTECIPQGTVAIAQMAARKGFEVDATENPGAFTDENLAKYDVVIWLCTTGDVLNEDQQAAFERYIRAGHGYVGIHSASDTEYDWAWYGGLVGAYFRDHPGVPGVNQQFQVATIDVEDGKSEATKRLPARWTREEEWYNFRTNPRDS